MVPVIPDSSWSSSRDRPSTVLDRHPPTVCDRARITRGSAKSTVATITEVAQYLRLLYARLERAAPSRGRTGPSPALPAQLRLLLARGLAGPKARRSRHLYLCSPVIRAARVITKRSQRGLRARVTELMRVEDASSAWRTFQNSTDTRNTNIEVVVCDLKGRRWRAAKATKLKSSKL